LGYPFVKLFRNLTGKVYDGNHTLEDMTAWVDYQLYKIGNDSFFSFLLLLLFFFL
jgi:hypothetical protein